MKAISFLFLLFPLQGLAEDFPRLDQALPQDLDVQEIAPLFDFDGDGCLPSAGISRTGKQNSGLKTSGKITGDCRSSDFLESSNTYHRSLCKDLGGDEYCGHFFSLYFEKDQLFDYFGGGHRHDWEYVAIWTINGFISHGSYSAHGDLFTKPSNELEQENGRIKFVYHKEGVGSHAMRFSKDNEKAENPYGRFVLPVIVNWNSMYGDGLNNGAMRDRLNRYNYNKATLPIKDDRFVNNLNRFRPSGFPQF